MSKVERGRWKFVIIASTALNSYPGNIKRSVAPSKTPTVAPGEATLAALSIARTLVVPTAIMRPPNRRQEFILSTT